MSDTGKQSPLGVNTLSSLLQNQGFNINPIMVDFTGVSIDEATATNLGKIVNETCVRLLTYAINDAYGRGAPNVTVVAGSFTIGSIYTITSVGTTNFMAIGASSNTLGVTFTASGVGSGTGTATTTTSYTVDSDTYNNLISIGATTIPALGNSKAPTFNWTGYPNWASNYTYSNEVTRWGYIRLFALQGYNEFNYNDGLPAYKDYLSAFTAASSFVEYTNKAIMSMTNSQDFLEGTYSNMNDLISADIAGVSLATTTFGRDLITTGKAINLSTISTFGLPSNLLLTLVQNNALTQNVSLALLASGIQQNELSQILDNTITATTEQERNIYGAFNLIVGDSLTEVLIPLNCKTRGLESLADLLNPQKLFPNSYQTLTVPVYNTTQSVTNSKTYYPIYSGGGVNGNLNSPQVSNQIGTQIPGGTPKPGLNIAQQNNTVNVVGQGGLVDAVGGFTKDLNDGNFLGAFNIAGTSYNTFKNSNLKQVAKADINGILTQATQQVLPGSVRSTTYYPGYGADADTPKKNTPGGGKAFDSFNNEAN